MLHNVQHKSSNATSNDANPATLKRDGLCCKNLRLKAKTLRVLRINLN
jgi:hypothetical protein